MVFYAEYFMLLGFALVLIPHGQQSSPFSHAGVVKKSEAPLLGLTSAAEGSMSMSSVLEFMSSMGVPVASSAGSAPPAMASGAGTGGGATASGVSPASPSESVGLVADEGPEYGNVIINNHCQEEFDLNSVAAYTLGGDRSEEKGGNGTWDFYQDHIKHTIAVGGSYTEPFRVTCPAYDDQRPADYCAEYDKLRGQSPVFKMWNPSKPAEILQFEYGLVQNKTAGDTYQKLWYDVSLLDCADPAKHPALYGHNKFNDLNMSVTDMQHKIDMCPGYQNGMKVSFKAKDGCDASVCRPIECKGTEYCPIYYFGRTYTNEPSMVCHAEFRGDMVLDLCAGNAGSAANTRRGIGKDEDVQSAGSV